MRAGAPAAALACRTVRAAGPSRPAETNENREARIRNLAIRPGWGRLQTRLGSWAVSSLLSNATGSNHRSNVMKWETPQASDMRYGFEITMYIATR